jgi:hypothetical protein
MPLADHDVHPLRSEAEARECAELMASMEPWRRLGYDVVGSLTDFIVTGHHDILLWKRTGSWSAFRRTTQER